jgi:hypothetical protein
MVDILKNGTNQVVVCPLVDSNYSLITGVVTPSRINLIINGGSDVDITSTATLVYSANAGGYKLTIPSSALSGVTDTAKYQICIKGTGFQNYNIDGIIWIPQTTFATASNLSNVPTAVWENATRTLTAIPAGTPTAAQNAAAVLASTIRTGRTVSESLRILEIFCCGTVAGLTAGEGSPVTITLSGVGSIAFTVDPNENRVLSSVSLV